MKTHKVYKNIPDKNDKFYGFVTKKVEMTRQEYIEHLYEKRRSRLRLIEDTKTKLAKYTERAQDDINEYQKQVSAFSRQIDELEGAKK
jgi:uncharacterized protein YhaN